MWPRAKGSHLQVVIDRGSTEYQVGKASVLHGRHLNGTKAARVLPEYRLQRTAEIGQIEIALPPAGIGQRKAGHREIRDLWPRNPSSLPTTSEGSSMSEESCRPPSSCQGPFSRAILVAVRGTSSRHHRDDRRAEAGCVCQPLLSGKIHNALGKALESRPMIFDRGLSTKIAGT